MGTLSISLEGHPDPESFIKDLREKYPDGNVEIQLKGHLMEVNIDSKVPLQLEIDIGSFLIRRTMEAIHG